MSESHIDISFASARICGIVDNWRMLEDESLSLHKYIAFEVGAATPSVAEHSQCRWSVGNLDKNLLAVALATASHPHPPPPNVEAETDQLIDWISKAADSCVKKKKLGLGRPPVPW